jgi:hypothetical protein
MAGLLTWEQLALQGSCNGERDADCWQLCSGPRSAPCVGAVNLPWACPAAQQLQWHPRRPRLPLAARGARRQR